VISSSLAAFINASEIKTAFGLSVFVRTPDFVESQATVPYCVIDRMVEGPQELWAIGDAQRKENQQFQVAFKMIDYPTMRDIEARFRRLIESATALDVGGISHPGIDFLVSADQMRNSGDNLTYHSDQPGWFATPTPVIYKNRDSNGEPIVVPSGYTVNSAAGTVTFGSANAPTDEVRATYKAGVIDFNIVGVARDAASDVDNNPQRYAVYFNLETFFYIKTNANRYL
jgi:hypothetical protein